eukprot:3092695-Amphidinium_carterae.1
MIIPCDIYRVWDWWSEFCMRSLSSPSEAAQPLSTRTSKILNMKSSFVGYKAGCRVGSITTCGSKYQQCRI